MEAASFVPKIKIEEVNTDPCVGRRSVFREGLDSSLLPEPVIKSSSRLSYSVSPKYAFPPEVLAKLNPDSF